MIKTTLSKFKRKNYNLDINQTKQSQDLPSKRTKINASPKIRKSIPQRSIQKSNINEDDDLNKATNIFLKFLNQIPNSTPPTINNIQKITKLTLTNTDLSSRNVLNLGKFYPDVEKITLIHNQIITEELALCFFICFKKLKCIETSLHTFIKNTLGSISAISNKSTKADIDINN